MFEAEKGFGGVFGEDSVISRGSWGLLCLSCLEGWWVLEGSFLCLTNSLLQILIAILSLYLLPAHSLTKNFKNRKKRGENFSFTH